MMVSYRLKLTRRRRLSALIAACVAVGVVVATLVVPRFLSNAGTNGVSTVYKTATNTSNGSQAASPGSPGGAKTGSAKPGDIIDWVVDYQNETASVGKVDLKDALTKAGAYVPGSLRVPGTQAPEDPIVPQFSTDGGANW